MLKRIIALPVICLALLLAAYVPCTPAQQDERLKSPPLSEAALDKVPPDLREIARKYIRYPDGYQREFLTLREEDRREIILKSLVYNVPQAADLVFDKLPKESPRIRSMILERLTLRDHWRSNPRVYQVLETMVAADPDIKIVREALDTLRTLRIQRIRALLTKRLIAAQRGGDQESVKVLAEEQERWISLERGTMLPTFLRAVPAPFALKSADQPVRVLAFGDFGTGSDVQKRVAAAMLKYHQDRPFDFGITLGDNFYGSGMNSPQDPRWERWWEELYKPLDIKFYASLGNHDWIYHDSPAAEILYTQRSATWRMPAPYYTYTAGPAQFFALDTNDMSEAQLMWLKEELNNSRARWKVVYGHHPIYLGHESVNNSPEMVERLLPVLRGRVDAYVAGHHHSLQHLKPDGGVHFIISGAGGQKTYSVNEREPRVLYARSVNGFTVLEATEQELTFRHVGADANELYAYTLRK